MVFIALIACSRKKQNGITEDKMYDKRDSILVTYYCGFVDTNVAMRCEKLAAIQEMHPKNEYIYVIPEKFRDAYEKDSSIRDKIELEYLPPGIIDTFITDKNVIDRIVELAEKRTSAPDFSEDARMYATIKTDNKKNDYLCFDHFPYQIKYNGEACSLDGELLFLLRYYSGYYSWFDISDLDWFKELRNTEFRQKVIEQINQHKN